MAPPRLPRRSQRPRPKGLRPVEWEPQETISGLISENHSSVMCPLLISCRSSVPAKHNDGVTRAEDQYIKDFSGAKALNREDPSGLSDPFPLRPCFGSGGRQILLWANYFQLQVPEKLTVFRYTVEVLPHGHANEARGKKLRRLIEQTLQSGGFPRAASDFGEYIYTLVEVPRDHLQKTLQPHFEDEPTPAPDAPKYRIRINPAGTLRVGDLLNYLNFRVQQCPTRADVFQALNSIVGHFAHTAPGRFVHRQNQVFMIDNTEVADLGRHSPLQASRGYFKSVRPASTRLLLNVNVSHVVLFKVARLDGVMRMFRHAGGSNPRLEKLLSRIRIETLHDPETLPSGRRSAKTKTILRLARCTDDRSSRSRIRVDSNGAGPRGVRFSFEQNGVKRWISVWDYFRMMYPHVAMDPALPVVNVGSAENPRYLPSEACLICPAQVCRTKLNAEETTQMLGFACRSPATNARSIEQTAPNVLGFSHDPQRDAQYDVQNSFGTRVLPGLITVPGRVLTAPSVYYRNRASVNPSLGGWNSWQKSLAVGGTLTSWTYLDIQFDQDRQPDNLSPTMTRLQEALRTAGMNISNPQSPPPLLCLDNSDADDKNERMVKAINAFFHDQVARRKLQLVFVLLPQQHTVIYNTIKTLCDTQLGLHTIHIVRPKLLKAKGIFLANIALKANLKTGGVNQMLSPRQLGLVGRGKTMMVGIDVTHPSPDSSADAPSVAAVVANIDTQLGQWPATISIQDRSRQEMVSGLEEMVASRLRLWRAKNCSLPEGMIIWRDGVSEGQYPAVLDQELPRIRSACKKMYSAQQLSQNLPRLTIVVAGKRHHTRFYPTHNQDIEQGAKGNCPNGTVVDRGVTEAQNWDFYLQAHQALQGTARPAHYYVLWDEIFRNEKSPPANALEELTHNLAYTFGRCTRAVSYCPAAYYADIVCERARRYLHRYFDPSDSVASETGSQAGNMGPSQDSVKIADNLRDSMFYL